MAAAGGDAARGLSYGRYATSAVAASAAADQRDVWGYGRKSRIRPARKRNAGGRGPYRGSSCRRPVVKIAEHHSITLSALAAVVWVLWLLVAAVTYVCASVRVCVCV